MRCPQCNQKLIQRQTGATQIRIKGKLLLKPDGAHTQCLWCGADVVLPLKLAEPPIKPGTKLVIRRPGAGKDTLDNSERSG